MRTDTKSRPAVKFIADLKAEGYTGTDVSLAISLLEYGLAWKEEGKDYRFIYSHPSIARRFDWGCIRKDIDPRREWDWVDWEALAQTNGATVAEILAQPLPRIVFDLVSFHGVENVFGSSYWVGFNIEEDKFPIPSGELIRTCHFRPYRPGLPWFRLRIYDIFRRDSMGKNCLGYTLDILEKGKPRRIFTGEDFHCSPCHAVDSVGTVESIMGFLTLRPGDTYSDYFDDYTEEQMAYCEEHAESLSCEVQRRFCDPKTGSLRKEFCR